MKQLRLSVLKRMEETSVLFLAYVYCQFSIASGDPNLTCLLTYFLRSIDPISSTGYNCVQHLSFFIISVIMPNPVLSSSPCIGNAGGGTTEKFGEFYFWGVSLTNYKSHHSLAPPSYRGESQSCSFLFRVLPGFAIILLLFGSNKFHNILLQSSEKYSVQYHIYLNHLKHRFPNCDHQFPLSFIQVVHDVFVKNGRSSGCEWLEQHIKYSH